MVVKNAFLTVYKIVVEKQKILSQRNCLDFLFDLSLNDISTRK